MFSDHELLFLLLFLLGRPSSEQPNEAPSFQIGSGWNFAGLLFKYKYASIQLTESDF